MSKLRISWVLSLSLSGSMLLFGTSVLASGEEAIPSGADGGGGSVAEQAANESSKISKDAVQQAIISNQTNSEFMKTIGNASDQAAIYDNLKKSAGDMKDASDKTIKEAEGAKERLSQSTKGLSGLKAKMDAAKEALDKCQSITQGANGANATSCSLQQMQADYDSQKSAYDNALAANQKATEDLKKAQDEADRQEKAKLDVGEKLSNIASACMATGQCYQDSNTGEIRSRSLMPTSPNFSSLSCGSGGLCTDVPLYSNSPSLGTPTGSPSAPPTPIDNGTSGYTGSLDPGSSQGYVPESYAPSTAPSKVYGGGGGTSSATPNAATSSNGQASNKSSSSNSGSGSGSGGSSGSSPASLGSGGSSSSNPFAPIAMAAGVTPPAPLPVNSSADPNEMYCRVNPTGPNCPSSIQPAVKASQTKVNGDDYSGPSSSESKTPFDSIASQALPRQMGDPGPIPQNQNTLGLPTAGNNAGDTAGRPGLATNNARSAALKAAMGGGSGFYGGTNGAISANSTSRSAAGHVPHTFGSHFGNSGMKLASTSLVGSQLNAQMGQGISRFPASLSPEVGKDGFTGPHTDLWRKVRNRYYDQSGSLNP